MLGSSIVREGVDVYNNTPIDMLHSHRENRQYFGHYPLLHCVLVIRLSQRDGITSALLLEQAEAFFPHGIYKRGTERFPPM